MTIVTKTLERLNIFFLLVVAVCAAQVGWWMFDRAPPFEMVSYSSTNARAGEPIFIDATVKRDLSRECSTVFSRHMFDSRGVRFDLSGQQMMSVSALRTLNQISPDKLRLNVMVPPIAATGRAMLTTVLEYRCNPWQESLGRPIRVEMVTYFDVLPS